ncbi:MAG: ATP-binding protein [Bacteroidia bacterium]|nr:ATP-binding protein [Bacteroidia bacterium]
MLKRSVLLPENDSFFLFGPRQTGKSTLIRQFVKNTNTWELNLLHTDLFLKYLKQPYIFRKEADYQIRKNNISKIFIDEIQKVPLLLNEIQALISEFPYIQFILTGSSARKLRHGDVNLLAGRLLQRYLFPFIFDEFQDEFILDNVLRFGSLPALYNKSEKQKSEILNAYAQTYLREEIQAEGIIRNLGGFSRFLDIAAAQCGELVNYSSIARDAALPVRTVQSYYEILVDTLIALHMEAWHKSVRKRLTVHPKYYLFDTGITNSICGRMETRDDNILRGRLFEQWIILETFRYIHYFHQGIKIYYWRTGAGAEVDLLFERGGNILAACEIKATKQITGAHLRGLKAFNDEHPSVKLYVIAENEYPFLLNNTEILPWKIYLERLKDGSIFSTNIAF